jgi:hypothetical protein
MRRYSRVEATADAIWLSLNHRVLDLDRSVGGRP